MLSSVVGGRFFKPTPPMSRRMRCGYLQAEDKAGKG